MCFFNFYFILSKGGTKKISSVRQCTLLEFKRWIGSNSTDPQTLNSYLLEPSKWRPYIYIYIYIYIHITSQTRSPKALYSQSFLHKIESALRTKILRPLEFRTCICLLMKLATAVWIPGRDCSRQIFKETAGRTDTAEALPESI